MEESKAWRLKETLEQLLQMQSQDDCQQHTAENRTDLDSFSSSSTSTSSGRTSRSDVRRCLEHLDRALNNIMFELEDGSCDDISSSMSSDHPMMDSQSQSQSTTAPETLRTTLLQILTEIDLHQLGMHYEYSDLHGDFRKVCEKAQICLGHLFRKAEEPQLLERNEAVQLFERVVITLQENDFGEDLSEGETTRLYVMLSLLNEDLLEQSKYAAEDHPRDDPPKTLLGGMLDLPIGEHLLQVLKLFFPAAKNGLYEKDSLSKLQNCALTTILTFLDFLLQCIEGNMKVMQCSNLQEYLQAVNGSSPVQADEDWSSPWPVQADEDEYSDEVSETINYVESYTKELLQSTLDALAWATEVSLEYPSSETDVEDVKSLIVQKSLYARFACTSLRLTPLPPGSSCPRALWIAYAKFFLAGRDFGLCLGFITETFVQLCVSALAETNYEESGDLPLALDDDIQHALSLTFLAAIDFPDILTDSTEFWKVMEGASKNNAELRHLVQAVALRGLLMPTCGAEHHPAVMLKVQQTLVSIGSAGDSPEEEEPDPWDFYFCEQVAMHREMDGSLERFEDEDDEDVICEDYCAFKE